MREWTNAPAHIKQGSSVTNAVTSSSRQVPSFSEARRTATTSACAVGSSVASRKLYPLAMTFPPASTSKHPTGTSPRKAASSASTSAARMNPSRFSALSSNIAIPRSPIRKEAVQNARAKNRQLAAAESEKARAR